MSSETGEMEAAELFETRQAAIARVIRFVCRRLQFWDDEAEDFTSYVNLKLIDGDYAILRKFEGLCSLETYLVTVIQRLGLDYRIQKWGKWRPSAAAKRLGEVALRLEALVYRDGHPIGEAVQILRTNHGVRLSEEELERLVMDLPERWPRRVDGLDVLEDLSADEADPAAILEEREDRQEWARAVSRLKELLQSLPVEDRIILRMHYFEGMTIADVARSLQLDAKPLYRRVEKLRSTLRQRLEAEGVSADRLLAARGK